MVFKGLTVHVFHTDLSVLEALKNIEAGNDRVDTFELVVQLKKVCSMLVQDTIQQYLNSGTPAKLIPLISELLAGPTQLA